jgi:hypothetical protein
MCPVQQLAVDMLHHPLVSDGETYRLLVLPSLHEGASNWAVFTTHFRETTRP